MRQILIGSASNGHIVGILWRHAIKARRCNINYYIYAAARWLGVLLPQFVVSPPITSSSDPFHFLRENWKDPWFSLSLRKVLMSTLPQTSRPADRNCHTYNLARTPADAVSSGASLPLGVSQDTFRKPRGPAGWLAGTTQRLPAATICFTSVVSLSSFT